MEPHGRSRDRGRLPNDETWEKLPFYADHDVDEVLIVDPQERTVEWLELRDGEYKQVERSGLIDLGAGELVEQLGWSSERLSRDP